MNESSRRGAPPRVYLLRELFFYLTSTFESMIRERRTNDYRKGKEINLTEDTTVAEYLEQNQYQVKRIAVELNGDILPKYSYSDTMLKDGDRLEVVTFVGGG